MHVVGIDAGTDPESHVWVELPLQLGEARVVAAPE